MSLRKRRTPTPNPPEFHPGQLLDWRHPSHWGEVELPCRYCDQPTPLRDSKRLPAHKVCAESALTAQYEQAAATYTEARPS